jgi:hypothetical protein
VRVPLGARAAGPQKDLAIPFHRFAPRGWSERSVIGVAIWCMPRPAGIERSEIAGHPASHRLPARTRSFRYEEKAGQRPAHPGAAALHSRLPHDISLNHSLIFFFDHFISFHLMNTPVSPSSTTAATGAGASSNNTAASASADRRFFFDSSLHSDGKFNAGWTESLRQAGFERLARKGSLAPDEATFLRSLDDTLGHVGKKGTGFPTAASTPEEIAEYRRSAGVPVDARGYALKPERLPDGVEWDEAGASEFAAVLHQHHAPAGLAKALGEMWANQQGKFRETARDGFSKQVNDLAAESARVFGREWGAEADTRRQANVDFVKSRGLDLDSPVLQLALSHPEIVRFVDEARRAMREAPLPGADGGAFTGSGTPREQAQAIMKADRHWQSDPAKVRKVNELYAMPGPGEGRKR